MYLYKILWKLCISLCRHSGESRNPVETISYWMPVFTGMTVRQKLKLVQSFLKYKTRIYATTVVIMLGAIAVVGGALFRGGGEETEIITSEPSTNSGMAGETTVPASAMDEENAQVSAQTDAHTEQIQQLLAQAENSVRELRLMSPAGNNAYEQYRQVLALDPANEQARTGLRTISDKYIALAYGAMKADTGKAGLYINKAREIWPESDKILPAQKALQARLDEIAKQKESAAVGTAEPAVAEQPAEEQQTEESAGVVGGVKKWFKDNAAKNKNTANQEGTGDQFVKSIGGGK